MWIVKPHVQFTHTIGWDKNKPHAKRQKTFQHLLFVFNIRPTRRMNVTHFRIKRNDIGAFTQPQTTHKLLSFLDFCDRGTDCVYDSFHFTSFAAKKGCQIWSTGFSRPRNKKCARTKYENHLFSWVITWLFMRCEWFTYLAISVKLLLFSKAKVIELKSNEKNRMYVCVRAPPGPHT